VEEQPVPFVAAVAQTSWAHALAWGAPQQAVDAMGGSTLHLGPGKRLDATNMVAVGKLWKVEDEGVSSGPVDVVQKDGLEAACIQEAAGHAANSSENFRDL